MDKPGAKEWGDFFGAMREAIHASKSDKGSKMACEIVDKIIKPCNGLKASIADYGDSRCKGIVIQELLNRTTHERSNRAQLRSGDFDYRNPILMNFCPFCGGDLRTWNVE